jgi:transketolase
MTNEISRLSDIAKEIRRRTILSLYTAQSGHPGPSLSWTEIATTLLFKEMDLADNPDDERDRIILSKGHGVATLYSAISILNPEYISIDQLKTLRDLGSPLQGHPVRGTVPYIDASTGSLGQGLSVGIGYALGIKLKNQERRVYVILGDGECQEGQVWEAFMAAPKFNLNNLVAIIDHNKFQNESSVKDTMPLNPLEDKLKSFGWYVQRVDGHNIQGLLDAYDNTRASKFPSVIIADTIKGKGISFMENNMAWHSKVITPQEYDLALKDLNGSGE